MLEAFNWVVNLFMNTPVQVIVMVLGSAGVSILSQVLKKWWKIENERWVFLLVVGIALAGSFLDWFINSNSLPATIIGLQTSVLVGIAQPIYFYVVKPLSMVIRSYRANKNAIEDKLKQVEAAAPLHTATDTLADSQVVIDAATGATPITPSEPTVPEFVETPIPRPVATF